jgi:hypothetical protein
LVFVRQLFVRFKEIGRCGRAVAEARPHGVDRWHRGYAQGWQPGRSQARPYRYRLIGNFGFSDVGRSFDGVPYNLNRSKLNLTLFGRRPTRGVVQMDGWGEININVFYGALTGQVGGRESAGE